MIRTSGSGTFRKGCCASVMQLHVTVKLTVSVLQKRCFPFNNRQSKHRTRALCSQPPGIDVDADVQFKAGVNELRGLQPNFGGLFSVQNHFGQLEDSKIPSREAKKKAAFLNPSKTRRMDICCWPLPKERRHFNLLRISCSVSSRLAMG